MKKSIVRIFLLILVILTVMLSNKPFLNSEENAAYKEAKRRLERQLTEMQTERGTWIQKLEELFVLKAELERSIQDKTVENQDPIEVESLRQDLVETKTAIEETESKLSIICRKEAEIKEKIRQLDSNQKSGRQPEVKESKITPELQARIEELIKQLGAIDWQVREKATKELIEIGKPASKYLKEIMNHEDPEVCLRVKRILEELAYGTFKWTQIADLPGDQHAACAAVIDNKLYLVGGQNPPGPPNYNKMRIYNPAANSWTNGLAMSTRRYWPSAGVITGPNGNKELYVVGGYSGYVGLSTVERYTPATESWEMVASVKNRRGHGIMTAVVNNNLYAIGGFVNNGVCYATNEMYDRKNNRWIPKAPIAKAGQPLPMQAGAIAALGDKIYIFGGNNRSGALLSTLIYDTLDDTWSCGANIPRPHSFGRAVTFGNYIYLFGGTKESKIIDVYNPVKDSWSTIKYPGNSRNPIVAQNKNLVYVLGDSYSLPAALECWVGKPVH